jgi:hypothetical protein
VNPFDEDTCFASVTRGKCLFDVDPSTTGPDECDFRVIFTPDQNNPSAWKNNASNPGQFFYNTFYVGDGSGGMINVELPYPFVTQGNMPIHFYDGVNAVPSMGVGCYEPGMDIGSSDMKVTMADYTDTNGDMEIGFGDMATLPVYVPDGYDFAYINIHLDWGLKGTNNYSKDMSNNAIDATTMVVRIPNMYNYMFSDDSMAFMGGGSDTCHQNLNVFKRDPGFAGLVLQTGTNDPVPNVKVQIYDSKNILKATVYTDEDGWYMWQYKHTGKATTFTVKLPDYNLSQSGTLKSNSTLVLNFTLP